MPPQGHLKYQIRANKNMRFSQSTRVPAQSIKELTSFFHISHTHEKHIVGSLIKIQNREK